ncbi:voltage-gated potassium channel [Roseovarius albus]|uniref:Voltage-gated potassium channel n=1 Tax=Roseovarius albus TaxID=1247867 RepID=A0A1X6Z0G9_9RHOB|nr:potassium channel family protein [Roseovarius albus]SLN36856.1 voltage-gated potassium channel [Roseovarius albus]
MKQTSPFVILITSLVVIVSSATVFFHYLEGWSWIDSYFFTVVTLSTVGYGNLVPETEIGKVAASILIFTGIGIFALTIQSFASLTVKRRLRKSREHKRKLAQSKKSKDTGPS